MGESTDLCAVVMENVREGIYIVTPDRRITYWNAAAETISGYSRERVLGSKCSDDILDYVDASGRSLCRSDCPLAATITDGQPHEVFVYLRHADGYRLPVLVHTVPLHNEAGDVTAAVKIFSHHSTLSSALKQLRELNKALGIDPLTGIGNRRSLELHLKRLITESSTSDRRAGLLFIDVDNFKDINDRYGHVVGDEALKMVANSLQHNVRSTDHVGRWGGEEFLVLLYDVTEEHLAKTSDKLRMLVASSYLNTVEPPLHVTISLGATLVRPDDTVAGLISRADSLLYKSKNAGRNRCTVTTYETAKE
ncbi:MAG: sensor domain-containing diguanylate cyclase [Thermoleophilia bacterium]|jgi:diguanylate cyclase (GGDEF)-like protein/PAS domain S-box-containing protein